MHVSLDGYIRAENNDNLSWIFNTYDDELKTWEVDLLWKAGLHVMGRNLYEEMAAYWPTSTEVYAAPMNEIPKAVFSRTLKTVDWKGTHIINGNVENEITLLKKEKGNDILLHGGAAFVHSLAKAGLIDEYNLIIHPVIHAGGLHLFSERMNLKLMSARSFPAGAILLTYEPVKPV